MDEKNKSKTPLEEFKKLANDFIDVVTELGDILAKILPDIEIPEEEKNTWEMKCPYKVGDVLWMTTKDGKLIEIAWDNDDFDNNTFLQGNVFPTEQATKLEIKRRNLLTRFRAFRDECNEDWKPDWSNRDDKKWEIDYTEEEGVRALWTSWVNAFPNFGYFRNREDAERAIELFGDEIKTLFVDCEEE